MTNVDNCSETDSYLGIMQMPPERRSTGQDNFMRKYEKQFTEEAMKAKKNQVAPVENQHQVIMPKVPVIGLYLSTRGRASLCMSTLNAWANTCGDAANVRFLIGVDEDDETAAQFQSSDGLKIHRFGPDVITCGGRMKELVDQLDVDIYLAINDKYFALTQYWDNALRNLMGFSGCEATVITYDPAPHAMHIIACSKRWIQLTNKYEPTCFPFWFSDQWRVEMYCYVFGKSPPILSQIHAGGAQQGTQHMREMDFWWGLFVAMRPQRLREAYEVYKAYGMTAPTFEDFVVLRRNWIDDFMLVDLQKRKDLPAYEAQGGEKAPPGEKYMRSKVAAEKIIADQGLDLWIPNC